MICIEKPIVLTSPLLLRTDILGDLFKARKLFAVLEFCSFGEI